MRKLKQAKQSEILFHHRFPTSTNNVRNACHPFSTKNYFSHNYVGVHNGVIWNDDIVAKDQMAEGVTYVSKQESGSFNDSEVLMYDIASVIEGKTQSLQCEGSIAFIIVQNDDKGHPVALYFGHNEGNPLKINRDKHGFSLTSEGKGENIETNKLFRYDYKTKEITSTYLYIPYYDRRAKSSYSSQYSSGYGDYEGYKHGYNWPDDDRDSTRIESKVIQHAKKSDSSSWAEADLDKYAMGIVTFAPDDDLEAEAVDAVKEALEYDTYNDKNEAIDWGELLLDDFQRKGMVLENRIQTEDINEMDFIDEYLMIEAKCEILVKALDQMKSKQLRLAIGEGVNGVRYTPDH